MKYDPKIHHRRSIRLPHWDYSWGWWYYVTIAVKDRRCDFGRVDNDVVVLSTLGAAADDCWKQIPQHHAGVELDDYVIMPNHVHGILILNDDVRRDVQLSEGLLSENVPTDTNTLNVPTDANKLNVPLKVKNEAMAALSPKKGSLPVILRTFKAAVTTWARENHHERFGWQERFHDHIIRNDADLRRIREYIQTNPLKWAFDEENPNNVT